MYRPVYNCKTRQEPCKVKKNCSEGEWTLCLGSNVLNLLSFLKSNSRAAFRNFNLFFLKISTRVSALFRFSIWGIGLGCVLGSALMTALGCATHRTWKPIDPPVREITFVPSLADWKMISSAIAEKKRDCLINKKDLGENSYSICDYLIKTSFINLSYQTLQPYGKNDWGQMMVTGYYQPEIRCSRSKSDLYRHALLKVPKNFVRINVQKFLLSPVSEVKTSRGLLRTTSQGFSEVEPAPERESVSQLETSENVFAFCEDVDLFFLQIQGSGRVRFDESGEIFQVTYADQNGYPYTAVGQYLKTRITPPITAEKIKALLRSMSETERTNVLNKNKSYVFFRESHRAVTATGFTPAAFQTAAVDLKLIPKNSLAIIKFNDKNLENLNSVAWTDDTGGAIKGPARLDLYMGEGDAVADRAGQLQHDAMVWFITLGDHPRPKTKEAR